MCIVGIVITWARHSAKIRAKLLTVPNKNYCNHNGSFWPKISPIFTFRLQWTIRYSMNKACCSFLLKESNSRPDRVSDGSSVNNMLKLWVFKLSFLKRHPSIQKSKILKHRALLQWKEKNSFRWVHPGSFIGLIQEEDCTVPKST
jgi:hypothetical protein